MIYGFLGSDSSLRGNGKTLSMTYCGYLEYLEGRKVYSNYRTSFSDPVYLLDLVEYFKLNSVLDSVMLITEIQQALNSIGTKANTLKTVDLLISQTRKRKVDFFYDTQRLSNVHVRLRDQTDCYFQPIKKHLDGKICRIDSCPYPHHIIELYSIKPYRKKPVLRLRADKVGTLYDTNDLIIEKDKLG